MWVKLTKELEYGKVVYGIYIDGKKEVTLGSGDIYPEQSKERKEQALVDSDEKAKAYFDKFKKDLKKNFNNTKGLPMVMEEEDVK